jgi:hypothetical protein
MKFVSLFFGALAVIFSLADSNPTVNEVGWHFQVTSYAALELVALAHYDERFTVYTVDGGCPQIGSWVGIHSAGELCYELDHPQPIASTAEC